MYRRNHYVLDLSTIFVSLWLKENIVHFVFHAFDVKGLRYTFTYLKPVTSFMVFNDLRGHCELRIMFGLFSGLS